MSSFTDSNHPLIFLKLKPFIIKFLINIPVIFSILEVQFLEKKLRVAVDKQSLSLALSRTVFICRDFAHYSFDQMFNFIPNIFHSPEVKEGIESGD